ncbi:DUF554 domain-containing protein [Desulfovibrio sp. OttesenSCG-928-C06]|nr:DUF554 domain-containing protein [Desulfovibrio sp. OttesenSCG-928-C06]
MILIGPIVDSGALAIGGVIGVLAGHVIPKRVKETLPLIFGVITIGMGTSLIDKASYMHVVVMALITGTFIGEMCKVEDGLELAIRKSMRWSKTHGQSVDDGFIVQYITLISAFCFGSMGIFGAINEGITGNPSILFTKAVLDLFSGIIFGALLGIRVSLIAIPQFILLASLYLSATAIMPCVTDSMLNDFTSTGGVIFLATGLRLCGIKIFPVINMLPGMLLVLPLSYAWSMYFL